MISPDTQRESRAGTQRAFSVCSGPSTTLSRTAEAPALELAQGAASPPPHVAQESCHNMTTTDTPLAPGPRGRWEEDAAVSSRPDKAQHARAKCLLLKIPSQQVHLTPACSWPP